MATLIQYNNNHTTLMRGRNKILYLFSHHPKKYHDGIIRRRKKILNFAIPLGYSLKILQVCS